jgi:Asp-tRNA(Asn)/Glu-tRNA(Gln) amidotransferase A subunit family amidase
MKIYISGKITGMESEAKIIFQQAEEVLTKLGFEVVNPMKLPHNHDKSYISYMIECLQALKGCDYIFMLGNWHDSTGANIEFQVARKENIVPLFGYAGALAIKRREG